MTIYRNIYKGVLTYWYMGKAKQAVRSEICHRLLQLEEQYGIKILFAIESGSRAWGMASKNSDYDVRFVYKYPLERYISIFKPKEVVTRDYAELNADFVGFDVRKFIGLLSASNPTAIEWLLSNTIYYGEKPKVFRKWAKKSFNPISLFHHYKSMAKQNYKKYIEGARKVTYKKYLYVMRGLINAKYVFYFNKLPPIKLRTAILDLTRKGINVQSTVTLGLIDIKKKDYETELYDRILDLDSTIKNFLEWQPKILKKTTERPYVLDEEMRRIILRIWNNGK